MPPPPRFASAVNALAYYSFRVRLKFICRIHFDISHKLTDWVTEERTEAQAQSTHTHIHAACACSISIRLQFACTSGTIAMQHNNRSSHRRNIPFHFVVRAFLSLCAIRKSWFAFDVVTVFQFFLSFVVVIVHPIRNQIKVNQNNSNLIWNPRRNPI